MDTKYGKIISIEEIEDTKVKINANEETYSVEAEGYKVQTDKHEYMVLISSQRNCCEDYGYLISEDNYSQFIGSNITEIRITDVALNQAVIDKTGFYGSEEDGDKSLNIQFVDFCTDRGVFQLAVYNAHNGYYGHEIMFVKDNETVFQDKI
jgi:hypothetical protein